jgi:hypothetical protein
MPSDGFFKASKWFSWSSYPDPIEMERLKIGYLTDTDPGDRREWSCIMNYMFRALERRGYAVTHPGS